MSSLIELGKRIFGVNPIQLLSIILCLGLAMVAQQLAVNLSGISLSQFISTEFKSVFSGDLSHFLYNVLLPIMMYMIAGILLVGMGVTNFTTAKDEESRFNGILKHLLALMQGVLFMIFFFVGGKLFLYSALFLLVVAAVAVMVTGTASEKKID